MTTEDGIRYLVICHRCKVVWACSRLNGKTRFCFDCREKGIKCPYQRVKAHQIERKNHLIFRCPTCDGFIND